MLYARKRQRPTSIKKGIAFPLVTIIVCAIALITSSFYDSTWIFRWEGIRQEVKDKIKSIDEYGAIPAKRVGYAGTTPKQWYQWRWLMKNTTEDEFLLLLDYPSGTIKAFAYEGLLRNTDVNQFDLLNKAIADTNNFVWLDAGCESYPMMLGEHLMEQVVNLSSSTPPNPNVFEKSTLTKEEVEKLREVYRIRKSRKEKYFKDYWDLLEKRGY